MRLLLHTCCANCLADTVGAWRGAADQVDAFWYNPNVHPLVEYRKRLKSARLLTDRLGMELHADDRYGLVDFLRAVAGREDDRCEYCYSERLKAAAAEAAKQGFDAFATTLSVSPQQDHDLLRRVGAEAAEGAGVEFVYRDLRELHGSAAALPKGLQLYHQQYCGCVYSEYDRYRDTGTGLLKEPGAGGPQ